MRTIAIEVGSQHLSISGVSAEGGSGEVTRFPASFEGHEALAVALGEPRDTVLALAPGDEDWRATFTFLHLRGFRVSLLDPVRVATSEARSARPRMSLLARVLGLARRSCELGVSTPWPR